MHPDQSKTNELVSVTFDATIGVTIPLLN